MGGLMFDILDTLLYYAWIYLLYWSVQSLIAISLLPVLLKMIDERESMRRSMFIIVRANRKNKDFMKNTAKQIALSPLGLVFVLVAIYRNRRETL